MRQETIQKRRQNQKYNPCPEVLAILKKVFGTDDRKVPEPFVTISKAIENAK